MINFNTVMRLCHAHANWYGKEWGIFWGVLFVPLCYIYIYECLYYFSSFFMLFYPFIVTKCFIMIREIFPAYYEFALCIEMFVNKYFCQIMVERSTFSKILSKLWDIRFLLATIIIRISCENNGVIASGMDSNCRHTSFMASFTR